eukprot:gene6373-4579_t
MSGNNNNSVFEIDGVLPVQATVVEEPVKQIQIPPGMRPGDSFIVAPENCTPFTVIVPEGAAPGSFITVIVPTEAQVSSASVPDKRIKIDKGVAGAAVVGGVVGLIVLGGVGGLVLAGGAAYAATCTDSKLGRQVHKVGSQSYKGIASAKNWVVKKLQK